MNSKTAFTLGRTKNYDESLATGEVKKCEGGWVFKTFEDAKKFWDANIGVDFGDFVLDKETFSVYLLWFSDSWDEDVSAEPAEDGAHRLLKDACIVSKVTSMNYISEVKGDGKARYDY